MDLATTEPPTFSREIEGKSPPGSRQQRHSAALAPAFSCVTRPCRWSCSNYRTTAGRTSASSNSCTAKGMGGSSADGGGSRSRAESSPSASVDPNTLGWVRSRTAAVSAGAIGGASDDAGVEYRRGVAAYAVAHGFAGIDLLGFGVPPAFAQVASVAVETDDAVDDVRVQFVSGWRATVQAKRTLRHDRRFLAAVTQWREAAERGLNPATDRLVLVSASLSKSLQLLAAVLRRLKTDEPGMLTTSESRALAALDAGLDGLDDSQRRLVHQCAVIHQLDVEEPDQAQAREARNLLAHVVRPAEASRAWTDLVGIAGRIGRMRGGYEVRNWLRLLVGEGHQVVGDGSPAAEIARQLIALDRYRQQIRRRGSIIDLHTLGSDLPPLQLSDVDAVIDVVPSGGDPTRDRRKLLWAFLARDRLVVTGLPGGGKSTALAGAAAAMLDVAGAPLPIVVSLADVDRRGRTASFRDRLLDTAVSDLPDPERALVRQDLQHRLRTGAVAVILDALDETYDRRRAVVAEIASFVEDIPAHVPVLLATRDIAYAQAAKLGWPELRLAPPEEIDATVRAVLTAAASAGSPTEQDAWVATRAEWVHYCLGRDQTLLETPLLPVLLALLAAERDADRLPQRRAEILKAVVRNVVERREARRAQEFGVGDLTGSSAARALLDGFAVEASVIADSGGSCSPDVAIDAIASMLTLRWALTGGRAEVTAEAIIRFWDETGIFVMSGAAATVQPRLVLFSEIGDALHAVGQNDAGLEAWIAARLAAARHEPVVLAAGLSPLACRRLVEHSCHVGAHNLLHAAVRAIQQGGTVPDETFRPLLGALIRDARHGDHEGWKSWSTLLDLPVPLEERPRALDALNTFSHDHRAVGRAVAALRWNYQHEPESVQVLLDALRVTKLPELPTRTASSNSWLGLLVDPRLEESQLGAARTLLGNIEDAEPLVLAAYRQGSSRLRVQLGSLLTERGLGDAVRQVIQEENATLAPRMSALADWEPDGHLRVLDYLATRAAPTELDVAQARRLAELGDLIETLDLNETSAWPPRGNSDVLFQFIDLVIALGGFDAGVLAAQAAIMKERCTVSDDHQPFFAPMDTAAGRTLAHWDAVSDWEAAVKQLRAAMFRGIATARVAAMALADPAVKHLAVPVLQAILPRLQSSHGHQRLAAHVLNFHTSVAKRGEWLTSSSGTLRAVTAEVIEIERDGRLSAEIVALLHDADGYVVEAAVGRLRHVADDEGELNRVAAGPDPGWTCKRCKTTNQPGEGFCSECRVGGPTPSSAARGILASRSASNVSRSSLRGTSSRAARA